MENSKLNSSKQNGDSKQWYLAVGQTKPVGPLTLEEVLVKLKLEEITVAHFVWRKGLTEWKRLCDLKEFEGASPAAPARAVLDSLSDQAIDSENTWYLHYNSKQFGPFSRGDVEKLLKIGKIHPRVFCWTQGFGQWRALDSVGVFDDFLSLAEKAWASRIAAKKGAPSDAPVVLKTQSVLRTHEVAVDSANETFDEESNREHQGKKAGQDRRMQSRKPLAAKILMTDSRVVATVLCRDISVGGMQVLAEHATWAGFGSVGAKIKLNVNPTSEKSNGKLKANPLKSFTAEGEVVRILEDGRGFSFRFTKLPESAKNLIETYVNSS